ncbi:MAG: hypothetical protein WAO58_00775 [Fimbriimonadaceae bacterium]
MNRDDVRESMLVWGGVMLFGSVLLLALVWLGYFILPILPWTLLAGVIIFGAAVVWEQARDREVRERVDIKPEHDDLSKAA